MNDVPKKPDGSIYNPKIPRYEKMKRILLWENPNPKQEIKTMTINLSSSKYEFYEVFFAQATTDTKNLLSVRSFKGNGAYLNSALGAGLGRRLLSYVDETTLKVNESGLSGSAMNSIPIKIFGYF